jgi:CRP/FNR family cyclic AMP-dependent transcriptional regulator
MSFAPRSPELISPSPTLNPVDLLASHLECEHITLPTGSRVFARGSAATAIYAVKRGIVELVGKHGEKTCYRPGELFSFQDIVWRESAHDSDALARTPVEVLRLERLSFLNLLHHHPTLALLLIGQQHNRLREQRSSGTCVY